jgi:hypothetical protein
VSIITNPAAVSSSGGVETLPDATAITLDIVVANIGNQSETNLTVRATIAPAGSGSSSVVDFVNLSPGQAYTINGLGPLNPPIGTPVTLTVTVTSQSGALPPTSSTLTFIEPDPNATTTTTAPPTTTPPTTAPAG